MKQITNKITNMKQVNWLFGIAIALLLTGMAIEKSVLPYGGFIGGCTVICALILMIMACDSKPMVSRWPTRPAWVSRTLMLSTKVLAGLFIFRLVIFIFSGS